VLLQGKEAAKVGSIQASIHNSNRSTQKEAIDQPLSKTPFSNELHTHLHEPGFSPWDHVVEKQQREARLSERLEEGLV
jgi:hypothetical protein